MPNTDKKRFFVDLFAGCGGLSLGLEKAGFSPILVSELNPDAMETYLLNRESRYPLLRQKYHVFDVKSLVLDDSKLIEMIEGFKSDYNIDVNKGELDLLAGGPPCQGFSGIGYRRSYTVDKKQLPSNYLYEDMAYLVSKFRPKIFLFENVKGLLSAKWTSSGKRGEIWNEIVTTFENIGLYNIMAKLVFAKEYDVPQNRPRVIMVGIRKDIGNFSEGSGDPIDAGFLPVPTNRYPNLEDLLSDLVDPNFSYGSSTNSYIYDPLSDIQKALRTEFSTDKIIKKGDVLHEQYYSKHSDKIIRKFEYMLNNNGSIPDEYITKKFAQRVLPAIWKETGPTITATSMPDDYIHYKQPRTLTVREWARLQTFPDWYKFSGKRTTGGIRRAGNPLLGIFDRELPRYTQIGNAVPVSLAYSLGKHFRKILDQNNS